MVHLHLYLSPLFSLSLLFGSAVATAQEAQPVTPATIEGTVFDAVSRAPIRFAVIQIAGSDSTTVTDRNGRYRLVLTPGEWVLEVRRIGYHVLSESMVIGAGRTERDLYMTPLPIGLQAVVVVGEAEDEATRIMRRAIARKNDVLARIHDYRYDAYVKLVVRDAAKDRDSSDAVLVITETQTTAYWEQPDRYQEVITARRQSSNVAAENNWVSVGQIVNFNRDRIDLDKYSVASPTADDALEHYSYQILDTVTVDGRQVFRVAIEPRSQSSPLFVGMIDVADSTYDVLTLDVGVNDAVRFEFFENIRYRQRMTNYGDDKWMPYEIRFSGEIHFGVPLPGIPKRLSFEHVASLEDFRFDKGDAPANLGEFLIVVDSEADDIDSTAWEAARPRPLADVEREAYVRIDSIENEPPGVGDYLLTGAAFVILTTTNHDFYHFNRVESSYLGAGWTWRDLSPDVVLRTKLGYSFGQDAWQYDFGGRVRVSERRRLWVGGGVANEVVHRPVLVSGSYNPTYLAFLVGLDPLEYYRETGFTVSVSAKLIDFTTLWLEYRDVEHASLDVTTDYTLFDRDRVIRPSLPVAEGRLRSLRAVLQFDSRPLLKSKGRDFRVNSLSYTRLTLAGEYAAPDLVANDFDFRRLSLRIHRRQRTLNIGMTTIDAFAGIVWGSVPPQRYFTVDFGKGVFAEDGGFHTLAETNFAGNRAAMVVMRHNFEQSLFRKSGIPLVRDIPFALLVHGAAFWTDFIGVTRDPLNTTLSTAPSAYVELGFGLGNLTPMLRPFNFEVWFSWQLSSFATERFEFRIGMPAIGGG